MYPDYWEFTGGSGVTGEDSLTSAHRELLEETGIDCPPEELIFLGTLRAPTKGMYPNSWEFTGGSGVSGEDSLTSAHRELSEETGIDCPPEELIFLGTLREPSAFMDCYLCRLTETGEDTPITLQEWETVDSKWVTFCEFETMIHKGLIPPPCAMRYGFVKAKLTAIIGEDAWLQADAEEVSPLENTLKEASHE